MPTPTVRRIGLYVVDLNRADMVFSRTGNDLLLITNSSSDFWRASAELGSRASAISWTFMQFKDTTLTRAQVNAAVPCRRDGVPKWMMKPM